MSDYTVHREDSEDPSPALRLAESVLSDLLNVRIWLYPVTFFLVGFLIVWNSRELGTKIAAHETGNSISYKQEDVVENSLNLKIAGTGLLLISAAYVVKRRSNED